MKTDNELIAEFMGIDVAPYTHYAAGDMIAVVPKEGCIDWPTLTEYCPDKSWDWLMPVVEKIATLSSLKIQSTGGTIRLNLYSDGISVCKIGYQKENEGKLIEATYKSVVEFIKSNGTTSNPSDL